MTPQDHNHDHAALTAYALGELSPAEAATISRMIAGSPEARAEYERIAQTVAALRKAPAIPRRTLHPRQRETVLAMGQVPARGAKVLAFHKPASKHRVAWTLAGLATAAALAIGAFIAGLEFASRLHVVVASNPENDSPAQPEKSVVVSDQPSTAVDPTPNHGVVAEAKPTPTTAPSLAPSPTPPVAPASQAAPAPAPSPTPAVVADTTPRSPSPVPTPVAAPENPPPAVAAVAPPASAPAASPQRPATPVPSNLRSFVLANATAETSIALQPRLMRHVPKPVPREFAGLALAAPLPERPKTTAAPAVAAPNPAPRKPAPQPPLVIHSWKAELASCPWDASRRLMRFVAQIPVDQEGVESNTRDYQISVKFDPVQVQAWRLITEKHMPPAGGSNLATRFAWYEIIPGRSFAPTHDKPAAIGTLDIVQPRGAARDSQPLRLLDRGLPWTEAREDFVFETAMVGFNLLLQGTENIGTLNHKLVLELAEQSRDEDPQGQRAKFIATVKQAQKAAGL